jgi:plastocyanin
MTQNTKVATRNTHLRWSLIAGLAVIALLGSYAFASSRARTAQAASPGAPVVAGAKTSGTGCACCGTAKPAGPATTGQAATSGGVQKISVDVSKGYYDPSTIELKAGVPAEITFSRSGGCTALVQSADLGFSADLTQGPATVKLPALSAGTYGFACGMNMVFGSIVVK